MWTRLKHWLKATFGNDGICYWQIGDEVFRGTWREIPPDGIIVGRDEYREYEEKEKYVTFNG